MNMRRDGVKLGLVVVTTAVALFVAAPPAATRAAAVAEITRIVNAQVRANLTGDKAFYEKLLAPDFTMGTPFGWETRESKLERLEHLRAGDPLNKINSEKILELKVRVYGDTGIATSKARLDVLVRGEHRAGTLLGTETFVKQKDGWRLVAWHVSMLPEGRTGT